jgi:hypothetical protein
VRAARRGSASYSSFLYTQYSGLLGCRPGFDSRTSKRRAIEMRGRRGRATRPTYLVRTTGGRSGLRTVATGETERRHASRREAQYLCAPRKIVAKSLRGRRQIDSVNQSVSEQDQRSRFADRITLHSRIRTNNETMHHPTDGNQAWTKEAGQGVES